MQAAGRVAGSPAALAAGKPVWGGGRSQLQEGGTKQCFPLLDLSPDGGWAA